MKVPRKKKFRAVKTADKTFENNLISVPWKNKEEWLNVYHKAYSNQLNDQIESYNTMCKWQDRSLYGTLPLGVKCTCMLLQGVIKDKTFHPEVQNGLSEEDLVLIYGGSIMRFLNFLGTKDIVRSCGDPNFSHETFYGKARKIGIPDWIVTVRHQISHGVVLPKIDLLRICITFLLRYLKQIYWEVDKKLLNDAVLKRPRDETLQEYFLKLLNVYVLLKEQQKVGCKNYNSIEDNLVRNEISNIEKYRLVSEQLDNAPWEMNYHKKRKKGLTEKDLKNCRLKEISLISINYIKEYNEVNKIDIWKIMTCQFLQDSVNHQSVRLDIWGSLIKVLSDRGFVTKFLDPLVDYVFKDNSNFERSLWARKWLIVLLQALLERSKVEKLKKMILNGGRKKKSQWEKRVVTRLTSEETKNIKSMLAKSKYDTSKKLKSEIYKTITEILERRSCKYRSKLKLICDPLDSSKIKEYIFKVCKEPNDFTQVAFDFFTDMLLNPSAKIRKSLKKLIDIYQGNCKLDQNISNVVYTLPMILKQLKLPEKKYLEWQPKEDESQINNDQETESTEMMENDSTERIYNVQLLPKISTFDCTWPTFLKLPWSD